MANQSMIMRSIFGREQNNNNNTSSSNRNNLKVLIERRRLSPLSLNDVVDDDDDVVVNGNKRLVVRKFSYLKLPQQLLKLTVLKLDGSSFDVNIGRNATVAELKQTVEEIFTSSPERGQDDMISWSHVWGHFCLSYENQKLINDKTCIRSFGIKDGDQLQFVRHMSINYSNSKRSTSQNATRKPLPTSEYAREDKEQKTIVDCTDLDENQYYNFNHCAEQEEIPTSEFKLAHFLKGWLSYSRLWGNTASRKGSQGQNRPSRFALQCLGAGRPRMIKLPSLQLYDRNRIKLHIVKVTG